MAEPMDSTNACSTCKQVLEITRCPICLDSFSEPKVLPCLHTFCLKCLDGYCEGKKVDELLCPLCRIVFKIPVGGNINLPSNFFICEVLQAKSSSRASEISAPSSTKLRNLSVNNCDEHPGEQNTLYCYDCQVVTCTVCILNKHRRHDLIDVNKSAEQFRRQLKDDLDNISAYTVQNQDDIERLRAAKYLFTEKIVSTRKDIRERSQRFLNPSYKNELMEELEAFEKKILMLAGNEEIEIVKQIWFEEIVNKIKADIQGILDKGTVWDISRTAHNLHATAEKVVKTLVEPQWHKLRGVEIKFELDLSAMDRARNVIGKLVFKG